MNAGKTALGLLAGIATGALLGILFAPDSGKNTRKKIVQKGEGYADDVKDKFNGLLDSMKEKYNSIRKEAELLEEKGEGKYEEVKAQFKNAMA
jgi:gas vesicle protein